MLKKIVKRIDWEIEQAKDYVEQAFIVKHDCQTLADLFIELAKEEMTHAEKLMKEGHSIMTAKMEHDEFVPVWHWMVRKYTECINDLTVKVSRYRSY